VDYVSRRALQLDREVHHHTETAVETLVATRHRMIDRDVGFRAQNSSDRQNLAFGCALKGENVAVLALDLGEFVFSGRLVAREKAACQKRHPDSQNYESNGSHNVTSYGGLYFAFWRTGGQAETT